MAEARRVGRGFDTQPDLGYTGFMYASTLNVLRRTISPEIIAFDPTLVKTGTNSTRVQRLTLHYADGRQGRPTVILKSFAPEWPGDPLEPDRERRFYAELLPRLDVAHAEVYYAGLDARTGQRLILMEDLTASHYFPPPAHTWTPAEMRCLLRAYARLHASGRDALPPAAERGWMWQPLLQARAWTAAELLAAFDDVAARSLWPPLPGVERLVAETLSNVEPFFAWPPTLLHHDVYPPNAGLPRDLDGQAILLDWEMAGWGPAEMDLAFLFLQPYRSARHVDRDRALDYYWEQRRALEGRVPPLDERAAVQRVADAVWALSLVPRAQQVAAQPFPDGSAAANYWTSMFGVLHDQLSAISGS